MNEIAEGNKVREMILGNASALRMIRGFELYQELINRQDPAIDKPAVQTRMRGLYAIRLQSGDPMFDTAAEFARIMDYLLKQCEENKFSATSFADTVATARGADALLREWTHKPGETDVGTGMIYLNEMLAYLDTGSGDISLHIRTANVKSSELIEKIREGFALFAEKLRNGQITCKNVVLDSWLLGPSFEDKVRMLLGDDVKFENLPPDKHEVIAAQSMALRYNRNSLENYLLRGEKPPVRRVTLSSDEFLQKFTSTVRA